MLELNAPKPVEFCDGMSRRDFIKIGGIGALGLTQADLAHAEQAGAGKRQKAVIQIFLVGGPSQLDTWDLKPDASDDVRGPFRPIRTNAPGIEISEHFPHMAQMADKFSLLRSVNHAEAPIHETGHQLMQTGYLFRNGVDHPHYGAVVSKALGAQNDVPPWVAMPRPIGNTGVSISHGQDAGYLGRSFDPVWLNADPGDPNYHVNKLAATKGVDPARPRDRKELLRAVDQLHRDYDRSGATDKATQDAYDVVFSRSAKSALDIAREPGNIRERYGYNTFGQSLLLARRLVQSGVRLVTVNMFDTVFNQVTWDMHSDGGSLAVTHDDYRKILCPMFDLAYTALLGDLYNHGLLDDVLVVAMGEFGRTPKLNPRGGRDHWPGVWSVAMAGGGVQGGRVIGSSDANGAYPKERPIAPAEVAATVYHSLDLGKENQIPGPHHRPVPITDAEPIVELF